MKDHFSNEGKERLVGLRFVRCWKDEGCHDVQNSGRFLQLVLLIDMLHTLLKQAHVVALKQKR